MPQRRAYADFRVCLRWLLSISWHDYEIWLSLARGFAPEIQVSANCIYTLMSYKKELKSNVFLR